MGSNWFSSQFHTWVGLGWIWWRSGGTIFLWWFSCEFTVDSLTLLMSSWSDMLVSSKAAFISSLLLISQYMWWILWKIYQASLGPHCFALLWLKPENFIILVLVFLFCPSKFSSSSFTHAITMWAYLSAESGVMVLLASRRPTPCSICWSSSEMVEVSLGRPCAPSIYVVATMYVS